MRNNPLNGLNKTFSGGSISEGFQCILSYLYAKFGDFFTKCTISLKYAHIHRTMKEPVRDVYYAMRCRRLTMQANIKEYDNH